MAAQTHADSNDFGELFLRHIPRSNDLTLVALKGHLLLEQTVNRLLAALLRKPEAIDGANFRFHQKLCLIRALLPSGPREVDAAAMLGAAEKLNTLRNRLAHHVEHPQIEALVREFLSLCETDRETKANPLLDRLKRAIALVCGWLNRMSIALERRGDQVRSTPLPAVRPRTTRAGMTTQRPPPVHSSDP